MREKNELAGIDHEAPRQRDFHSSSRLGYPRLISLGGAMNLTLMVQARHGELSDHAQMVTCHGCDVPLVASAIRPGRHQRSYRGLERREDILGEP